jgi:hypothetical protein
MPVQLYCSSQCQRLNSVSAAFHTGRLANETRFKTKRFVSIETFSATMVLLPVVPRVL